jgi:hypothetical protein
MAKIIDKRKEIREEGATKVLVASYWGWWYIINRCEH